MTTFGSKRYTCASVSAVEYISAAIAPEGQRANQGFLVHWHFRYPAFLGSPGHAVSPSTQRGANHITLAQHCKETPRLERSVIIPSPWQ